MRCEGAKRKCPGTNISLNFISAVFSPWSMPSYPSPEEPSSRPEQRTVSPSVAQRRDPCISPFVLTRYSLLITLAIATEAVHSLIVSCAAEKPASPQPPSPTPCPRRCLCFRCCPSPPAPQLQKKKSPPNQHKQPHPT